MSSRFLSTVFCGLLLTSCQREQRSVSEIPAAGAPVEAVRLSALEPGAPTPGPATGTEYTETAYAISQGRQLYARFNCVGCHAPNGGGGMGPSLSEGNFKFGSDPARLFLVISHGAPEGMPSWGSVLPEQAIWDLVAYVESISKAPQTSWGQTVSPAAGLPDVEQVPAEFKQTPTPWQFTQRFGNGQAPPGTGVASEREQPPGSGSSGQ